MRIVIKRKILSVSVPLSMLAFGLCYGQQPDKPSPATSPAAKTQASLVSVSARNSDDRYRIGPGDLLSVTTLDYPQLSSDAIRVDSRGMVLLPLVDGEVQAACLTEGELAQEITKRYLKFIREPQVKVFVKDYQSQNVAVIGAVNAPGRFQLQRRLRLLELLSFVGGPSGQAGRSIQIFHAGSSVVCEGGSEANGEQLVSLSLSQTMRGEDAANPYIVAGDIVTVPDADQYFVMGNVAKPAAYALKDKVSLTQAIVMAGGALPGSTTDHVRILRERPGAPGRQEIVVDLKQAMNVGTGEVFLEPNDIIEVPKKGGLTASLKTVFRTMIPTLTSLPLRVIY